MKNLLVITLFFSTTAFTNINLICDKPYYFFPDLEKRVVLSFDTTKNVVHSMKLSRNLMDVLVDKQSFSTTDEYYKFGYLPREFVYLHTVNRTTLKYINNTYLKTPEDNKCKKVDDIKLKNARRGLLDYRNKNREKRKI